MGRSIRYYLFEESGEIKRISRRVMDGLTSGTDAIPVYAGTRQRMLEVIVDHESREAPYVARASGFFFEFDGDGRIDRAQEKELREAMNLASRPHDEKGNVVALSGRRAKKEWSEAHRWKPTAQDLDRVLGDIIGKPGTKALPAVEGIAERRPPLSYEAKSVITQLRSEHSMWNWQIRQLSEKSLPGFVWEARSQAKAEPEDQFLWEAVAAEGERQRELKRLRRTGKGQWVAVLQIFTHEHHASMEETFVEHRECEGENAAIETMKAMIVEHHGKVGSAMSIEARTMPALEWTLMNGRPH